MVFLKLDETFVETQLRKKYENLLNSKGIDKILPPTSPHVTVIKSWRGLDLQDVRTKLPLIAANRRTIHKEQNATHNFAILKIAK